MGRYEMHVQGDRKHGNGRARQDERPVLIHLKALRRFQNLGPQNLRLMISLGLKLSIYTLWTQEHSRINYPARL